MRIPMSIQLTFGTRAATESTQQRPVFQLEPTVPQSPEPVLHNQAERPEVFNLDPKNPGIVSVNACSASIKAAIPPAFCTSAMAQRAMVVCLMLQDHRSR